MKLPEKRLLTAIISIITAIVCMSVPESRAGSENEGPAISSGKIVSIEYTLKLEDQSVVDSNVDQKPMTYVHGMNKILPGLEKGLEGMKAGEEKHIEVAPEEGYGTINEKAIVEISRKKIHKDDLKEGELLQSRSDEGKVSYATIKEIREDTVVLDHNHPLAGKTLYFDVRVLDVMDHAKQH